MRVDAFDFDLPRELIAQHPESDRDHARLMVMAPERAPEHARIGELAVRVPAGALVVLNDTRVIPARLVGRKRGGGGRVELLLVRAVGHRSVDDGGIERRAEIWCAMGKLRQVPRWGADIEIPPREPTDTPPDLVARILARADDGLLEIALFTRSGESIRAALATCGRVPLPPYIKRKDGPEDAVRYQTVYARHDGAVAAPTAGLHLTRGALDRLSSRGCEIATITLHIGLGTFRPVLVDDLDRHPMHGERYTVGPSAAAAVARARHRHAPIVAVGTTTTRALESAADPERPGIVRPVEDAETRLLIQPGHAFRVVDVLLTNFHLPRSTLLALTCAFGGVDRVLAAYRLAVRESYRFFSYGDAMLLWRAP